MIGSSKVAWFVVSGLLAGICLASEITRDGFCVAPGELVGRIKKKCDSVQAITEYTEEGGVLTYLVSFKGFRATVESDNQVIELIRFRSDPLPFGVRIGESFSSVRARFRHLTLVADAGEEGAISLADKTQGFVIVFDPSTVPTDWYFKGSLDETDLAQIKVVAVNLVSSQLSKP